MTENIIQAFIAIFSAVFVIIFAIRWFIIIPYIYLKYDRKIIKLKNEFDEFRKKAHQQPGVINKIVDGQINRKKEEVDNVLEIIETKRQLFLDRVNLFLTIFKLK